MFHFVQQVIDTLHAQYLKQVEGWLFWAIRTNHQRLAALLLKHPGTDVNKVEADGFTHLTWACAKGLKEIVRLLLAHPAIDVNKAIVNATTTNETTPLTVACDKGHKKIVELLLAHPETDVNKVGKDGITPLRLACCAAHKEIVQLLLAHPEINTAAHITNTRILIDLLTESYRWNKKQACDHFFHLVLNNCFDAQSLTSCMYHPVFDFDLGHVDAILEADNLENYMNSLALAMYADLDEVEKQGLIDSIHTKNVHILAAVMLAYADQGGSERLKQAFTEKKHRDPIVQELIDFASMGNVPALQKTIGEKYPNVLEACKKARPQQLAARAQHAAELFALTVFVSDGLLQIKKSKENTDTARFFKIASTLPLELQMLLCHRAGSSMKDIIAGKDSQREFKQMAACYPAPTPSATPYVLTAVAIAVAAVAYAASLWSKDIGQSR